jgi:adenosylhomocysteine nucleosidase
MRHAERVVKLEWPVDFARKVWLNGRVALLVANGPGPKLAARAVEVAREHEELTGLVSTGFCGALDPDLRVSDIFIATAALSRDRKEAFVQPIAFSPGSVRTGQLLSVDRVASTAAEKAELRKTGADVIEMEASGVARKAAEYNLPFYCLRVVTDTAREDFPLDFNEARDADGRFSRTKILAAALRRPSVFPQLIRFNRQCKTAAQALGDFIANTRF